MDNNQDAERAAQPEQQKSVLFAGRMIRIRQDPGVIVIERCLGLGEAHAVLAEIGGRLGGIPLEPDRVHRT